MNGIDRRALLASASLVPALAFIRPAAAQLRARTLRVVLGGSINSLDPMAFGATREATNFSFCTYDRLIVFGRKQISQGWTFDFDTIRGELAESFEVTNGGKTIIFHLRRGATWHDGTSVSVEDIKWSLDRNLSAKGMSKSQILTGSLASPDQFTILDENRIQVSLPQPDHLALPNLCCPYAPIYQGSLAKKHATADDPWAGIG